MAKIDFSSKIEQLEAFEDRIGVSFKSLSAFMNAENEDYMNIDVNGEVHAKVGTKVKNDFIVVIAAYDSSDRLVGKSDVYYDSNNFFGFDTFSTTVDIPVSNISKVRIYPKKD